MILNFVKGVVVLIKIYFKSILITVLIGAVVGIITSSYMNYSSLVNTSISPPAILFPIVWTILYILMGVSYGILKANSLLTEKEKNIYYLQLFVNYLWPIFFFVFDLKLFSFLWILLLIVLVFIMIKDFYNKNKIAGLLQIPYLLWLVFAAFLNLSIYLLNR